MSTRYNPPIVNPPMPEAADYPAEVRGTPRLLIASFSSQLREVAAAVAGDEQTLRRLASSPGLEPVVACHRVGPALAVRSLQLGVDLPADSTWRKQLRASAARRMILEFSLAALGTTLAEAGIPWIPIKGLAMGHCYQRAEERPTSDLDVLIRIEDLTAARKALTAHGWRGAPLGPLGERYLVEEGYNWKAADEIGLPLELHYRLWGAMPEGVERQLFERSLARPELAPTARILTGVDAYLVAAVHIWLTQPERPLLYWWELDRLAQIVAAEDLAEVIRTAHSWGLQLLVGSSAAVAAQLWGAEANATIAAELLAELRVAERLTLRFIARRGPHLAPFSAVALARLLAGRPSRSGWRVVLRRLWAHPGTVEAETESDRAWFTRRLAHLGQRLGLR